MESVATTKPMTGLASRLYVLALRFLPLLAISLMVVAGLGQFTPQTKPASILLHVDIHLIPRIFGVLLLLAAATWLWVGLKSHGFTRETMGHGRDIASMMSAVLGLTIFSIHFALGYRDRMITIWLTLFAVSCVWAVLSSRAWILLISFVLLPFACFTLVVGGIDAFDAEALASRFFGVVLLLASAVMLVGSVWLFLSEDGRPLALVASLVGLLMALLMLVAQLSGFERDLRILLWIGILGALTASALTLVRAGTQLAKLAPIAAVVSTIVGGGLIQFWYTNQYLPTTIRPGLNVLTSIEKTGLLKGDKAQEVLAVSVRVSAKNISTTRVILLGGIVRVWGVNQDPDMSGADPQFTEALNEAGQIEPEPGDPASRFTKDATWEAIYVTRWVDPVNSWLDPSHEGTGQLLVYVPKKKYDFVTAEADIWFAQADRLRLGRLTHGGENNNVWALQETSLVNEITRNQRYVHEDWRTEPDDPDLNISVRSASRPHDSSDSPRYISNMEDVYGITVGNSGTAVLSLWEKP